MAQPLPEIRVQSFQMTFVTIEWPDGRQRTVATTEPAELISLGILVNGGATPEVIDQRFQGKISFEPKKLADVMQRMQGPSAN